MRSRKNLVVGVGVFVVALFGSLSAAHAQYAPPPPYYPPPGYGPPPPSPRGMYRSGLLLGFAVGGGSIQASDCGVVCGGAFMGEFHIGGMINPRLAIEGDFWLAARGWNDPVVGDGSTIHSIDTLALQYWAADIFWIKGGLGFGRMQLSTTDVFGGSSTFGDETGLAIMGAAGIEVVQAINFALDLQFRAGHGFYSGGGDVNNFALMVGFNWY